jgi:hypothetical protein
MVEKNSSTALPKLAVLAPKRFQLGGDMSRHAPRLPPSTSAFLTQSRGVCGERPIFEAIDENAA